MPLLLALFVLVFAIGLWLTTAISANFLILFTLLYFSLLTVGSSEA